MFNDDDDGAQAKSLENDAYCMIMTQLLLARLADGFFEMNLATYVYYVHTI